MKTERRFRSDHFRSIHSTAEGLYKVKAIDARTMREFDLTCLTTTEGLDPARIRAIREKAEMSQAVFASVLNVSVSIVSKWERGEKKPSGPSLKLLALADRKGVEAII